MPAAKQYSCNKTNPCWANGACSSAADDCWPGYDDPPVGAAGPWPIENGARRECNLDIAGAVTAGGVADVVELFQERVTIEAGFRQAGARPEDEVAGFW